MVRSRTFGSHDSSGASRSVRPNSRRERFADGLQVIARIKARRDFADVLAKRFRVAKVGGARQHIDLRARVVDVIFAGGPVARKREKIAERVAEHRAPRMADMHGAGRVRRDEFDVDRFARAERAPPVVVAALKHGAQRLGPEIGLEREVDEAGAGDLRLFDIGRPARRSAMRWASSFGFRRACFGERHGGVGGEIAVGGFPWRLDHETIELYVRRQNPFRAEVLKDAANAVFKKSEDIHGKFIDGFLGRAQSRPPHNPALCLRKERPPFVEWIAASAAFRASCA